MTQTTRLRLLLATSVGFNLLLLWSLLQQMQSHIPKDPGIEEFHERQRNRELYRVLPKNFYTRNEFAVALTYPTDRPLVRDCMVSTLHTVYIFDRTNTLIAMYEPGPNPFIPDPVAASKVGFKCDSSILEAQTQRNIAAAAREPDRHLAVSQASLKKQLVQDEPEWDRRR